MARVTVEDCVTVVGNRFELVALAAQRAKNISAGSQIQVEKDNDKNAVIALREIAVHKVDPDILRENLIQSLQKRVKFDKSEADILGSDSVISEEDNDFTDELNNFDINEDLLSDGMTFEDEDVGLDD